MTYRELVRENADVLDAKNLILGLNGWSLTEYALKGDEPVNEAFLSAFSKGVERLRAGEPVQYVLSEAFFYGYPFYVDRNVLIPRLDTEILVSEVLREVKGGSVLDLCTGSGCIGITLKKECPAFDMTLADLSEGALSVATRNAGALGAEVKIVHSDLFSEVSERFDVVVSNPPYICSGEIETLDRNVKDFEPRLALDGTEDGLFFYRAIAREAGAHLKEGGRIYFEIGCDQGETVAEILRDNGFREVKVIKDLAGLPRVVKALK